jgi:type VI protein secretion system component VasF
LDPAPPNESALISFYRDEFVKHHKCLQAQREYYSAQAIENAETALLKIIADLDRLSEKANAEQLVAQLLREFDVVTGLSGWSDPCTVH